MIWQQIVINAEKELLKKVVINTKDVTVKLGKDINYLQFNIPLIS